MLFFYQPETRNKKYLLEDEEYQHCIKVLRKKVGDEIGILDGRGGKFVAAITEITGKLCRFRVLDSQQIPASPFYHHIAIAPTKNMDRVEWFVEKACELGVNEISFIQTHHSERTKLRTERLEKKAVSALKQSKSGYLTRINPIVRFPAFIKMVPPEFQKFIAVAEPGLPYLGKAISSSQPILTLIGPEGDFDTAEIDLASESGCRKISLGSNILRTETAGLVACHFVNVANQY